MPFYRIVIWTNNRKQPYQGIRFMEQTGIERVYEQVRRRANAYYNQNFKNIEVQMLSNECDVVKRYIELKKGKVVNLSVV